MRRSIFYQPLAVLMAFLLLPGVSWMTHSGGSFQAGAQIQICSSDGSNGTSNAQIVNTCRWPTAVTSSSDWVQFQNNAIADYLSARDLPPEEAATIFTYGRTALRTEIRGQMFARLLNIIQMPQASRSPFEQRIYAGFQKSFQKSEIQYLTETINEWNRWRNNPCGYTLDPDIAAANNLSYDGNPYCFGGGLSGFFAGAIAPGAQYFEAVGLKRSYGQLIKNNSAIASAIISNSQLAIAYGAAAGGAAVMAAIMAVAATVIFPESLGAAVGGEILITAVIDGVTTVIGTVSEAGFFAAAVLGPAAIISLAIIIGVIEGFQVFNAQEQINQLNGLSATLASWQAAPQDLTGFIGADKGLYKLSAVLTDLTTPEVASTAALPVHRPGVDPFFVITPSGQTTGQTNEQLNYLDWLGRHSTASTYGGWLVQTTTGSDGVVHDNISPTIHFVDWSSVRYAASRKGTKFLVSKAGPSAADTYCPADPTTGLTTVVSSSCVSYETSSLQLKDASGNNVTVSLGSTVGFTSSASTTFSPGVAKTFTITATGTPFPTITETGALPSGLTFNSGNPATISGTAAAGTEGAYPITLKAQNGTDTVTQIFTLYAGTLNLNFTSPAQATFTYGQPSSFTITTTGSPAAKLSLGFLPQGMTFTDNGNGTATISGTPASIVLPGSILNCPLSGCGITATNAFGSVYQNLSISVMPVPLTISSSPASLPFTVTAGTSYCSSTGSYTTSKTLSLIVSPIGGAELCAVGFDSTISGTTGTRYVFQGWSDNGNVDNPRVFWMPPKPTTYSANFQAQYYLTTSASPGGTISPGSGWFNGLGLPLQVTATPDPGYAFAGFTGDLTGTANPQSISLNAPHSIRANFGLATSTALSAINARYSDSVVLSATVSASNPALNSSVAGSLQFSVNGVNIGSPVLVNGAGTYNIPYTVTQSQGAYPIQAGFTGSTGVIGGIATNTLNVARENATVTPSPNNPMAVSVAAAGGTASFTLTVAIQESGGGSLGDISKATPVVVTLNPTVSAPTITCPVTTSLASGVLTAVAACSNVPVNAYDAVATIGGSYYTGSTDMAVGVYDLSLGAVSGAGTLQHGANAANFEVNAKYDKSGQPQGTLTYKEHRQGADVTINTTAVQSMSIVGNSAVILSKATVNGQGNYTVQATLVSSQPSSNGLFGLLVTDPAGNVVPELSFIPINLKGGTIQVAK